MYIPKVIANIKVEGYGCHRYNYSTTVKSNINAILFCVGDVQDSINLSFYIQHKFQILRNSFYELSG